MLLTSAFKRICSCSCKNGAVPPQESIVVFVCVGSPALRAHPQALLWHIPGPENAFKIFWRSRDDAHVHRGRVAKHRCDSLLQVPELADIPWGQS